jgi:hypothetical protein
MQQEIAEGMELFFSDRARANEKVYEFVCLRAKRRQRASIETVV